MMEKAARIRAICERYHVPLKAAALQFILAHPAPVSVMPGVWFVDEVMAQQTFPVVGMDDTGNSVLKKHCPRRALMRCALCRLTSVRSRSFKPSIGTLHAHHACSPPLVRRDVIRRRPAVGCTRR